MLNRCARFTACTLIAAGLALVAPFDVSVKATSIVPMTFDELVTQASSIFRGEVVDIRSEARDLEGGRGIVTVVTFTVASVIKGPASSVIQLEFLGGTIGNETMRIAEMPTFQKGDRAILFTTSADHLSPIVGFSQGRFPILIDFAGGREVVTTPTGKPVITVASIGRTNHISANRQFPTADQSKPSESLSVADFEALIRLKMQAVR
jgi:hypothetical protein